MAKREKAEAPSELEVASEPMKAPETKTPQKWADVFFKASAAGVRPRGFWAHAAAEALHAWKRHEHHAGAPMALSREGYLAALEAAKSPPKGEAKLVPHKAALSPYAPKRGDK